MKWWASTVSQTMMLFRCDARMQCSRQRSKFARDFVVTVHHNHPHWNHWALVSDAVDKVCCDNGAMWSITTYSLDHCSLSSRHGTLMASKSVFIQTVNTVPLDNTATYMCIAGSFSKKVKPWVLRQTSNSGAHSHSALLYTAYNKERNLQQRFTHVLYWTRARGASPHAKEESFRSCLPSRLAKSIAHTLACLVQKWLTTHIYMQSCDRLEDTLADELLGTDMILEKSFTAL